MSLGVVRARAEDGTDPGRGRELGEVGVDGRVAAAQRRHVGIALQPRPVRQVGGGHGRILDDVAHVGLAEDARLREVGRARPHRDRSAVLQQDDELVVGDRVGRGRAGLGHRRRLEPVLLQQ